MSEDRFLKKLKRFTPKNELDRDSLMFAAGEASARKERRRSWLIVALAVSQMTTLVLLTVVLWPRNEPAAQQFAGLPPGAPPVVPPPNPAPPQPAPPAKSPAESPDKGPATPPTPLPEELIHREKQLEFVRKNRGWLIENLRLLESKNAPEPLAKPGASEQPPSFEVPLLDGRKITVRPKMEKLALYMATADMMEQQVRRRLAKLFIQYPDKTTIFGGIVNPGPDVPVQSRPKPTNPAERQTVSTGEPLDQLADVEITGVKGPQAADLERMVRIHWTTFGTVYDQKGMTRTKFEKLFGVVAEVQPGIWVYSIGGCRVLVHFEGEPARVSMIEYVEAPPPPNFDALAPSERGPYFRAVAKIDRDFLFAFLKIRYREADAEEIANLRRYLDETAGAMEWTEKERSPLVPAIPQ